MTDRYTRTTYELAFGIAKSLGCNPTEIDDMAFDLTFQGENFRLIVHKRFISVWDPGWYCFGEEMPLSCIYECVNDANHNVGPAIMVTEPDSDGDRFLNSKWDIFFPGEFEQLSDYLCNVLTQFFVLKHRFLKLLSEHPDSDHTLPEGFNV